MTAMGNAKGVSGAAILILTLSGCWPEEEQASEPPPVRGLVTTQVKAVEETTVRRYPGVLEPGEVNVLSFEVGGRLGRLGLIVGQQVSEGQLLAELDAEQFSTQIENRAAAVEEARATLRQAEEDLARSQQLLDRGVGTVVRRDEDRTEVATSTAQLTQAEKDLASAEEDLADSKLYAPFDGVIDDVEAESFATVSAGETVVTLYEQSDYEVSFSVNFDVVGRLVVGTPATVRLADDPSVALRAVVSELGERAGTVSSFPVVVQLEEVVPIIKAGMAVEVAFEFALPAAQGFLLPISAAIPDVPIPEDAGPNTLVPLEVYVYDGPSGTVRRRAVKMAGLRENQFLIVDGLESGEHVATKGVTFLREGMAVNLLADD
ncbi:MAG: efflux RND transporter periplasmic adaptor subunit [Pseudomonadota bacterium]